MRAPESTSSHARPPASHPSPKSARTRTPHARIACTHYVAVVLECGAVQPQFSHPFAVAHTRTQVPSSSVHPRLARKSTRAECPKIVVILVVVVVGVRTRSDRPPWVPPNVNATRHWRTMAQIVFGRVTEHTHTPGRLQRASRSVSQRSAGRTDNRIDNRCGGGGGGTEVQHCRCRCRDSIVPRASARRVENLAARTTTVPCVYIVYLCCSIGSRACVRLGLIWPQCPPSPPRPSRERERYSREERSCSH